MQSNLSGWSFARAAQTEATTKGVAALAAKGAGLIDSLEGALRIEPSFTAHPALSESDRMTARNKWQACVNLIVSSTLLSIIQPSSSPE